MSGPIRPTTRRYLQLVSRQPGLTPGDVALEGEELIVNAQYNQTLDVGDLDLEGQDLAVAIDASLTLEVGDVPLDGQEIELASVVLDVWNPEWLVRIDTPAGLKRFSGSELDDLAVPYEGRLEEEPVIETRLPDDELAVIRPEDVTFTVALKGGFFPPDAPETFRGRAIEIDRFDRVTREIVPEFAGVLNRGSLRPNLLKVTGTDINTAILETEIATRKVDTVTWPKAVDAGAIIPVVLGNVAKVPAVYVREDLQGGFFDYIVAHGTVTIFQAYYDGPSKSLYKFHFSECVGAGGAAATSWADASLSAPNPGFTTLRFIKIPLDKNNGRLKIYVDIIGLQAERNFVRAIQTVLTNTAWGLGQTVDTASFDAAAVLPEIVALQCDGAILEAVEAQDVLEQLLMVRRMRLGTKPGTTHWTIAVDTLNAPIKLVLRGEAGDGPRNLLDCQPREAPGIEDAASSVTLEYRPNHLDNGRLIFTAARTLQAIGRPKPLVNAFIVQADTADRVAYFEGQRTLAGERRVTVLIDRSGRYLRVGDLVSLTYTDLGFTAATMQVHALRKGLDTVEADLRGWTAAAYTHVPGVLPPDQALATFDDLSRLPPDPATGLVIADKNTEMDADGHVSAWAEPSFTVPTINVEYSIVYYKKTTSSFWSIGGTTTQKGAGVRLRIFPLVTNVPHDFRVQTVSPTGNPSLNDATLLNQLMPKDGQAPLAPSSVAAVQGTGKAVRITPTGAKPADWHHWNYYRSESPTFVGELLLPRGDDPGSYLDTGVEYAHTYYYRVSSVDASTNESGKTAAPAVTVNKVDTPDLEIGAVETPTIDPGAVSARYASPTSLAGQNTTSPSFGDIGGTALTFPASGGTIAVSSGSQHVILRNTDGAVTQHVTGTWRLLRNAVEVDIASASFELGPGKSAVIPLKLDDFDSPGAGAVTYKAQWKVEGSTNGNVKLEILPGFSAGTEAIDFKR